MNRRQWVMGAVGALALGGGAGAAWWRQRHARAEAAALDAMWGLRFEKPGGGELVMAELRGKPLVINFWATWCAPCVRELPEVDRFARNHAAQGVQVIGLAIDGPTPVREFLGRVKIGFPIGLAGLDGTDLIHDLGNLQGGLPFSVLIGADGSVQQRRLGETSYDELQRWVKATA